MADSPLPTRPAAPTPASVEDMEIILFDPGLNNTEGTPQSATYRVQLKLSDGSIEVRQGNLLSHLTNAEINGLKNLLARLRGKAKTAWLILATIMDAMEEPGD